MPPEAAIPTYGEPLFALVPIHSIGTYFVRAAQTLSEEASAPGMCCQDTSGTRSADFGDFEYREVAYRVPTERPITLV